MHRGPIDVVDIAALDDRRFASAHALRVELDLALDPDLTPTPPDELRLMATSDETDNATHVLTAAFDGDTAIGLGHLELTRDIANPEFCSVEVDAAGDDPAVKAHVLLDQLDRAAADGRTTMLGWGLGDDGADFWDAVGAPLRYTERISQLDLATVDAALMAGWTEARHARAADVTLVGWTGACPDELLGAFVVTRNAMNDAPLDEIDMADTVTTADIARRDEDAWLALGWEPDVLLAIDPDGAAVAMTAVLVDTHRPDASWQWDTVVLADHRRRGIGRWIKAAMWERLRAERPDVATLRTGNAESNEGMLAINVAMGFRPKHVMAAWQADISTLRAGVADLLA